MLYAATYLLHQAAGLLAELLAGDQQALQQQEAVLCIPTLVAMQHLQARQVTYHALGQWECPEAVPEELTMYSTSRSTGNNLYFHTRSRRRKMVWVGGIHKLSTLAIPNNQAFQIPQPKTLALQQLTILSWEVGSGGRVKMM